MGCRCGGSGVAPVAGVGRQVGMNMGALPGTGLADSSCGGRISWRLGLVHQPMNHPHGTQIRVFIRIPRVLGVVLVQRLVKFTRARRADF